MNARLALSGALYLWISLTACSQQCFRDPRLLGAFRVLGVRSEPVTVAAGQTVTLSLVSVDVRPRDVQVAWYLCPALVQDERTAFRPPDPPALDGGSDLDAGPDGAMEPYRHSEPDASADGAAVTVDHCLSRLPFATGSTANLRMPDDGGFEDLPRGDSRRAVDVVGFACAGGTIGAPIERISWPTCKGSDAHGVVFVHRVFGPRTERGAEPSVHPTIVEVRFGTREAAAAIDLDHPPVVPRCINPGDDPQCPRYRFDVVLGANAPRSRRGSQVDYVISSATHERYVSAFGRYPLQCPFLLGPGQDLNQDPRNPVPNDESRNNSWDWMAPERPGTVRLFVYVMSDEGGFAWTERRVVVE